MKMANVLISLLLLTGCSSDGASEKNDAGPDGGDDGGETDEYDTPCTALPDIVEEILPEEGSSSMAWHWVGDVNGDSYGDWVVSWEDSTQAVTTLFLGYAGFDLEMIVMEISSIPELLAQADASFLGTTFFASNFRHPSGMAGDVDGDGLWDILFGRPAMFDAEKEPEVFLVYGRTDGWEGALDVEDIGVRFVGETGSNFGWSTQGGDIDGDGYSDIVISDPGISSKAGSLRVFYGSDTRFQSDMEASQADLVLNGAPGLRAMRMEGFWFYNDFPNNFVTLPEVLDQQFLTDAAAATTASPLECGICDEDGEKDEEWRLITEGPRRTGTGSLKDLPFAP